MTKTNTQNTESLTVVSRLFQLDGADDATQTELTRQLTGQPGIVSVQATAKANTVRVSYDVASLDALAVGKMLEAAGARLRDSRWQKMRIAWFGLLDGNQRDNARHQPTCCSKPPVAPGRRD